MLNWFASKYLIIGAALLVTSLSTWAFMERSGRLSARNELERCQTSVALQNERIEQLVAAEARAKLAAAAARKKAQAAAKAREPELKRLREALAKPAHNKGCEHAWDFIER